MMATTFWNFQPDKPGGLGHNSIARRLAPGGPGEGSWDTMRMTAPEDIATPRLRLTPLDARLARLQTEDRAGFFDALGVEPEPSWPPELMDEQAMAWTGERLQDQPGEVGWRQWVFVSPILNRLVGAGGFKGRPDTDGQVEIGYAMLVSYREQGLATEAVLALIDWAYAQPGVRRIVAHTLVEGAASRRVLEKAGFVETGQSHDASQDADIVAYRHHPAAQAA